MSDNKISYSAETETSPLITVNGVKSIDGLSLNGKVITVAASSLGTDEVSISDGYTLALADDVTKPTEQNPTWTLDKSTALYKATTTTGYTLSDNKIAYSTETETSPLITVNGVKSIDGLSLNGKVVTVAASLGTDEVSISDGYTLALANNVPKPTEQTPT